MDSVWKTHKALYSTKQIAKLSHYMSYQHCYFLFPYNVFFSTFRCHSPKSWIFYSLNPLLCPWEFSGKNTGMGCHFLLQRIFLTQGSKLGLLHCRWMLYSLSHRGSPFLNIFIFFQKNKNDVVCTVLYRIWVFELVTCYTIVSFLLQNQPLFPLIDTSSSVPLIY